MLFRGNTCFRTTLTGIELACATLHLLELVRSIPVLFHDNLGKLGQNISS